MRGLGYNMGEFNPKRYMLIVQDLDTNSVLQVETRRRIEDAVMLAVGNDGVTIDTSLKYTLVDLKTNKVIKMPERINVEEVGSEG